MNRIVFGIDRACIVMSASEEKGLKCSAGRLKSEHVFGNSQSIASDNSVEMVPQMYVHAV